MPKKQYKKRIEQGLTKFCADTEIQGAMFDRNSSAADVGDVFQMVADDFEDGACGESVKRLFRDAGFSPQNPFHFGYLIELLAEVHYTDGKRGRPITRTSERAKLMHEHLNALARENNEYRIKHLAKLYIEKCPDRIRSLKTPGGVLTAMNFLKIKIPKPASRSLPKRKKRNTIK
jgi:hypothetical protein